MGIWDKVSDEDLAKSEGIVQAPYMNEQGRYLIRITSHKVGISQTNRNEIKFVPEFEVLQTSSGVHPVGCRRSDVIMIDTGDEAKCRTTLGKAKAHLAALENVDQSRIGRDLLGKLENNPLHYEGRLLWLDVLPPVPTKNGKTMITPRQYIHIPKDRYQQVLADARRENEARPVAPVVLPTEARTETTPAREADPVEAEQDW